jgi:signal transduction histidine kinase
MLASNKDGESLAASEEEMYAASCYSSLATLYPNITHELRGKLSNIVLHLELLRETQEEGPLNNDVAQRQKPLAEIALQEIYTFNHILQCLLDLMQPAQEWTRSVDLVQMLEDLSLLAEAQAKRQRLTLTLELPGAPQQIKGNAVQLRQALMSLILLAMADVPSAGSLLIKVLPKDQHLHVAILEGSRVSGQEGKKSLMDPPPMAAEQRHLALFAAKSIITRHGGSLEVAASPGTATAVRLSLPLSR